MSTIQKRKITVVGAGYVGSTCAHLCALKNLESEIGCGTRCSSPAFQPPSRG